MNNKDENKNTEKSSWKSIKDSEVYEVATVIFAICMMIVSSILGLVLIVYETIWAFNISALCLLLYIPTVLVWSIIIAICLVRVHEE